MRNDFAVFITTHGRPNCKTFHTLRRQGYTGQMFCVVDDLDTTVDEYVKNFGKEHVLVFEKYAQLDSVERMTSDRVLSTVLYARHACFELADALNIKYFMICDDDIELFRHKYDTGESLKSIPVESMDEVLTNVVNYFATTNVACLGISDSGAFFGGRNGAYQNKYQRMISVCYLCKTDDPIEFGSICFEDLWSTVQNSRAGKVLFETMFLCHSGEPMGSGASGGTTDFYKQNSLFKRNWYDVIAFPDCFYINQKTVLGRRHVNMCPKIVSSTYRRVSD